MEIWIGDKLIGWLSTDDASRFAFSYSPAWLANLERFALSPKLPLTDMQPASLEEHSAVVRHYFDNLLPEGRALDEAAQAQGVSKANLIALLIAMGRESAGALRICAEGAAPPTVDDLREVTHAELSQRIRDRPQTPISVWDGRVRLSIAGYQDKMAVIEQNGAWYLPDGLASSTHILKLDPVGEPTVHLTTNEFVAMRLAKAVGIDTAAVRLVHVPEPVLVVERFDRRRNAGQVDRVHVIDGCQALGLSSHFKYERQFGSSKDVAHIRDGASLEKLFGLLNPTIVAKPIVERQRLLRWALFQLVVANSDAHAKNLSFFCNHQGIELAPAYDIVAVHALDANVDHEHAMAIGDAFTLEALNAEEWSEFSIATQMPLRVVATELQRTSARTREALPAVVEAALAEGANAEAARRVREVVLEKASTLLRMAKDLLPTARGASGRTSPPGS
ncbi:MAG: HipA domain-containing protein [Usitatibacter sp.]